MRALSLFAALPLLGSAFLIPPPSDLKLLNSIVGSDPKIAMVKLPCTGCKYLEGDEQMESDLLFLFRASPGSLTVNGESVIPFQPSPVVAVQQIPRRGSGDVIRFEEIPTTPVTCEITVAAERLPEGMRKGVMSLKVLTVGGEPVSGLDIVQAKFLQGFPSLAPNDIIISHVTTRHISDVGFDGEATKCDNVLCKVREFMAKKVEKSKAFLKGCKSKRPPHGAWRHDGHPHGTWRHDGRPHGPWRHDGPHRAGRPHPFGATHMYHGDHPHSQSHFDKPHYPHHFDGAHPHFHKIDDSSDSFTSSIVYPILLGIATGIMVMLSAIAISRLGAMLYFRLRGIAANGCPYKRSSKIDEAEEGLLQSEEGLPAYDELNGVEVVEKA